MCKDQLAIFVGFNVDSAFQIIYNMVKYNIRGETRQRRKAGRNSTIIPDIDMQQQNKRELEY